MGRHSRKEPAPGSGPAPARPAPAEPAPYEAYEAYEPYGTYEDSGAYEAYTPPQDSHASVDGFDAFGASYDPFEPYGRTAEPTVTHQGYAPPARPGPDARGGDHPQLREPGGAWGAAAEAPSAEGPASGGPAARAVYGDWRGAPRARTSGPAAVPDSGTPASGAPAPGTPASGFPRVTLGQPDLDPATSTGSHRLVPGPRRPATPTGPATRTDATGPAGPTRPTAPAGPADTAEAEEAPAAGPSRSRKVRTYTGVAAAAVTTVLAVVVAGQVATEDKTKASAISVGGDVGRAVPGQSAASRGDGRSTPDAAAPAPAAPELTFEQKMAQQLPIDAKLKGPGTFDTVPGVAKAPGKGKLVRYRVDVEQGLGLDPQLFAEAVQRTLNDDRSWSHKGAMTFERVPGGEADFVITLASPGTTGIWCAKSDLDTTVDNVSCDSASTQRVMINAFRWAQGSVTFGANAMFAYRQMLINHEVGHRLGHGHVSCKTPGALAPIMQQQTKSLDLEGIHCQPNPWVFPGG
ncbi:DUF3152 domain-containing protein [Streptomyces goshikiensis]|uniref:DUF3152 domain-containing protein n=1 Tax=Streptomyces goshikiensis TaxID=1942 RepID=UPI00371B656A